MAANVNTGVEKIFAKYDNDIYGMGLKTREFLLLNLPGCAEEADPNGGLISYHYGKGYRNIVCTILVSKQGIKIGFYGGAALPDPKKLLRGAGKVHKHMVIDSENDLLKPALKKLLKEAIKAHKIRCAART